MPGRLKLTEAMGQLFGDELKQPAAEEQPAAAKKKKKTSKTRSAEEEFAFQLRAYQLPPFVWTQSPTIEERRQLNFAASIGRRWRFDFAFPDWRVAVEIEGLVVYRDKDTGELVVKGRHASITGFKEDCIKYANAAALGWTVVRFEQSQVKDKTAINLTQRVLYARGWRRE